MIDAFTTTHAKTYALAVCHDVFANNQITKVFEAGCDYYLTLVWKPALTYEHNLPLSGSTLLRDCFELDIEVGLTHKASSVSNPQYTRVAQISAGWFKQTPVDDFSKFLLKGVVSDVVATCYLEQSLAPWVNMASSSAVELSRFLSGYLLRSIFSGAMKHGTLSVIEFNNLVRILVSFVGKGLDGKAGLPLNNSQYQDSFDPDIGIYSIMIPGDPLGEIVVVWGNSKRTLLEATDVSIPVRTTFKQTLSSIAGLYPFALEGDGSQIGQLKHDYKQRELIFQAIHKVNQILKEPV